ncbi:GNAT family N-acetyltransferase [Flavisolibacter ginsengisoli]|jgi:GNAT superfamily N-acetyltransferase|uniref:Acetyltransferase (GNAT) domain-containing protein n=1 Tax=Flavisolibacter ginsengisoli DSM 18119 TaxID=1121884 RepID=A0A1M5C9Y1_9BACT|nr:GNAT family N-acetyltransferase [Flavisolibacter ginsengisoli]SHF51549.1 Acetyltransferase (GNAT) domain-containing protein [Flavisolibacter ginsengisoli DSM 18119]
MEILIEQKGDFIISTDKSKLDLSFIHGYLSKEAYWSKNIPFDVVQTAANNSLNFGLYYKNRQIGYARVITDYATIAYLGDVFIISEFRGQGLSKWMLDKLMNHPGLQGLRRWILLTRDAHMLYKKYGWTEIASPEKWMEKHDPGVYAKTQE